MVDKIRTDLSVLYGVTGASVTPGKRIPRKKRNMKSLETSPPRKDPIPNKYINTLETEKRKVFYQNYLNFVLDINQ